MSAPPITRRHSSNSRTVLILQADYAHWFKVCDRQIQEYHRDNLSQGRVDVCRHCHWLREPESRQPVEVELILDTTLDEVDRVVVEQGNYSLLNHYRRWVTLLRLKRDYPQASIYPLPEGSGESVAAVMRPIIPAHWSAWLLQCQLSDVYFSRVMTGSEVVALWSLKFNTCVLLQMNVAGFERHILAEHGLIVFLRTLVGQVKENEPVITARQAIEATTDNSYSRKQHCTTTDSIEYLKNAGLIQKRSFHEISVRINDLNAMESVSADTIIDTVDPLGFVYADEREDCWNKVSDSEGSHNENSGIENNSNEHSNKDINKNDSGEEVSDIDGCAKDASINVLLPLQMFLGCRMTSPCINTHGVFASGGSCHAKGVTNSIRSRYATADTSFVWKKIAPGLSNSARNCFAATFHALGGSRFQFDRRGLWDGSDILRCSCKWLDALQPSYQHALRVRWLLRLRSVSIVCVLFSMIFIGLLLSNVSYGLRLIKENDHKHQAVTKNINAILQHIGNFSLPAAAADSLLLADQLKLSASVSSAQLLDTIASVVTAHPDIELDGLSWNVIGKDEPYSSLDNGVSGSKHRRSVTADRNNSALQLEISGRVSGDNLATQQRAFEQFIDEMNAMGNVSGTQILDYPADSAMSSNFEKGDHSYFRVSLVLGSQG